MKTHSVCVGYNDRLCEPRVGDLTAVLVSVVLMYGYGCC